MFNALTKLSRCGRITSIYAKRLAKPGMGRRHISQVGYVQGPFKGTLQVADESDTVEKMSTVLHKLKEINKNSDLDMPFIPKSRKTKVRESFGRYQGTDIQSPEMENAETMRIMEKIVNTFIDYANSPENDFSNQPDFVDDFFFKSRAPPSTLGREMFEIPISPEVGDVNEEAISRIEAYINMICRGTAHGNASHEIVKRVESYLARDDIAKQISRETLNTYLLHLRREGDFVSIRHFINTVGKNTVLAKDILPYNYFFFTLSTNRRVKRLSTVEMTLDATLSFISKHIPVKFSTWQCIYQLVGYAPGRKLLDVMLENKFPLQKMFYKIMGNNKYLYETCDDFLDFIDENKDVFGELNHDQYMQTYTFYGEMDQAERLFKECVRDRSFDISQLKTLVNRFCYENEIHNAIAIIQLSSWLNLDLSQGIRKELYKKMLLSYVKNCNYDSRTKSEKEFLVLFFRYLLQRSHKNNSVRAIINEYTSPKFWYAVSRYAANNDNQMEIDKTFAREINYTLKWTEDGISFRLENNKEPFQKLVRTFIYPELAKASNSGEESKGEEIDAKDDTKGEETDAKDDTKGEEIDAKDGTKEEVKDDTKEEVKNDTKEEVKDDTKEEVKDA
ncbi:hypothetical protein BRETT_005151 [Brettanomyces bruxellensis]|uniref:Uncharacterized protein n=1 Tax=Dekkera bruxellensis TaxID=5007 RepID=A0A871R273_DEKBR|nr:uncharacterized protein BRETT_005151 [Brettanomyces bruxellensis]QOU20493.1 hypothetical protein BRETT_005151 [Brettanomyces bruxellensis]